jgi:hypothetical protein
MTIRLQSGLGGGRTVKPIRSSALIMSNTPEWVDDTFEELKGRDGSDLFSILKFAPDYWLIIVRWRTEIGHIN